MSGLVIGGDTAWRVRSKGDIGLAYHWVAGEASMVIYPLSRGMRMMGGMPYVLPMSAAHELVLPDSGGEGVNAEELIRKAERAAEVIGAKGDQFIIRKIADILLEGLDELCDMPPEPDHLQKKVAPTGEATFKVDGQTIVERDI
jgi:hypothetical protein